MRSRQRHGEIIWSYKLYKANYNVLVPTSSNHWLWVSWRHLGSPLVQIHELVTILEELELWICKQRLLPSWFKVPKWSLELEMALQELCFPKQSVERDGSRPSPLDFKHKPVLDIVIGVSSLSWLHLLELEQLVKKISLLSFETWTHWPLWGWYITFENDALEFGSVGIIKKLLGLEISI